jgi:hypothetical protein
VVLLISTFHFDFKTIPRYELGHRLDELHVHKTVVVVVQINLLQQRMVDCVVICP